MRLVKKARQIVLTHGLGGLTQRALRHIRERIIAHADAAARRAAWEKSIDRLGAARPVFFPRHEQPLVSIIIPAFNGLRYTAACLNALLRELGSVPCEVIVINDGSTDATAEYLDSCSGLKIITHVNNRGFADSVNDGAAIARGQYLHFLSNDALVTPGWMVALLRVFDKREAVAGAGSQLRFPDGTVSEAGALVWRDGCIFTFGRGQRPNDPGVAFPREVDYCSTTSLMVRTAVFRQLGGFSGKFGGTFYEDVDLCFRMRAAGYSILYQPESIVAHLGVGNLSNDAPHAKHALELQREIFANTWRTELAKHYHASNELIDRAARRLTGQRTALVVDSFIPFDDRSAGGMRLLAIMRLMRELDWHVIFVADDGGEYEPYVSRVRRAGVEVISHGGDATRVIQDIGAQIDLAWVSRPDLLEKYLPQLRRKTTAIVYDTVDLHFLRLQREAAVTGRENGWKAMRDLEAALVEKSDCAVVTSSTERDLLIEAGLSAHVIPIIEQPVQTHTGYSARKDVLFLANYTHQPNVDAAVWLINEIMPLVWAHIPNLRVILAGAEPTPVVQRLGGECVLITGHLPDIRSTFEQARVFVAPLRFGAGMKGKIIKSLAHALPVVTTACGAEGIGLRDGESALIGDDARTIADGIVRLYNDETLWKKLANNGQRLVAQYTPQAVKPHLERVLAAALNHQQEVGVDVRSSANSA